MTKLPEHLIAGEVPALKIYLNGVEAYGVVEAHTGEGWLRKVTLNFEGEMIMRDGEIATELVHGNITAELIDGQTDTQTAT